MVNITSIKETNIIKENTSEKTTPDFDVSQSLLIETGNKQDETETTTNVKEGTSSTKPTIEFCLHKGMINQNLAKILANSVSVLMMK